MLSSSPMYLKEPDKLKLKSLIVTGLFMVSCFSIQALSIAEKTSVSGTQEFQAMIAKQATQEHLLAAEQLKQAAGHKRKAAQYYNAGKVKDAGWNACMAYAHELRAQVHIESAAKLDLKEAQLERQRIALGT